MHEVDWDSLYDDPCQRTTDAILALIWREVEGYRHDNPPAAFALIQIAHAIEKGKHLGA